MASLDVNDQAATTNIPGRSSGRHEADKTRVRCAAIAYRTSKTGRSQLIVRFRCQQRRSIYHNNLWLLQCDLTSDGIYVISRFVVQKIGYAHTEFR